MLAIVECNEKTCVHHDEGYCTATWVEIDTQECMTFSLAGEDDEEEA